MSQDTKGNMVNALVSRGDEGRDKTALSFGEAANQALIRGFPNGETRLGKPKTSTEYIGVQGK